jgi:hypothetical protein
LALALPFMKTAGTPALTTSFVRWILALSSAVGLVTVALKELLRTFGMPLLVSSSARASARCAASEGQLRGAKMITVLLRAPSGMMTETNPFGLFAAPSMLSPRPLHQWIASATAATRANTLSALTNPPVVVRPDVADAHPARRPHAPAPKRHGNCRELTIRSARATCNCPGPSCRPTMFQQRISDALPWLCAAYPVAYPAA